MSTDNRGWVNHNSALFSEFDKLLCGGRYNMADRNTIPEDKTSIEALILAAEKDDNIAQAKLSLMYLNGYQVFRND